MTENEFMLNDRLEKIKSTLEQYGEDNFYLSFSGGKDSTILHHLVDIAIPNNKIPRVFADTGIEFNMIRDFVYTLSKEDDRIVILKPKTSIKEMLEKDGYPFKSKEHSAILSIFRNSGFSGTTVLRYLNTREDCGDRFRCPKCLEYQFSNDFKLKVSDKCCKNLKIIPLRDWSIKNNKKHKILGIRSGEGGRRYTAKCLVTRYNGDISFHPLAVVSSKWEEWVIQEHNINICDIYKQPYNFNRTGCKGCPFNIKLQEELDILEKYFPSERNQCEIIWKPVYDEYRRINYRLKEIK